MHYLLASILCVVGCASVTVSPSDPDAGASPDASSGIVGECEPRVCAADECGKVNVGCNQVVDCGECPTNTAFVTSQSYTGALGGLVGADANCQSLAEAANLVGTYRAWLSADGVDARDRLAGGKGWKRVDGKVVARTVDDLLTTGPLYTLLDEYGDPASSWVLTGTMGTGDAAAINCENYTSDSAQGQVGFANHVGPRFTEGTTKGCAVAARLYCFGIDHSTEISLAGVGNSRVAFVSSTLVTGDIGLSGADAVCNGDAAPHWPGRRFKAYLTTREQDAVDRFDLHGPKWVRPDGVELFETAGALAASKILTGLALRADGSLSSAPQAWVGKVENGREFTCQDWSDATSDVRGMQGGAYYSSPTWWQSLSANSCSFPSPLYCFESD